MAGAGRVVVVTGASRGVGYAIGRELATRMPGAAVYLTTRQANLAALDTNLRRDIGVAADNARFRFMDLKDRRSIHKFVDIVKRRHNRLDILVNNAGIYHKPPASLNEADKTMHMREVEEIVKTNWIGLNLVTEAFLPVLAPNSRIINMTSHLSDLRTLDTTDTSGAIRAQLTAADLTVAGLDKLLRSYVESIKVCLNRKNGLLVFDSLSIALNKF